MHKSDRIKAEVSLREVVEATGIKWDKHKSNPRKGDYWAPCPLHPEDTSSFHVVEPQGTGGWWHCFGGCEGSTVIDFVMAYHGIDFKSAIRKLSEEAGLIGRLSDERRGELEAKRKAAKRRAEEETARKAETGIRVALHHWNKADCVAPTVRDYLGSRGVNLAIMGGLPPTIRQIDDFQHRNSAGATIFTGSAMIAAIGREKIFGIHRTWITRAARARHDDGRKVEKQWMGKTGEIMGKPVLLSPPSPAVIVGEGIETTLTAYSGLLEHGKLGWSAEAAISRGAITGPVSDDRQLWVPRPDVSEVLILGEGSKKNPLEARQLYECAQARLQSMGFKVALRVPFGRWDLDLDFNDVPIFDR